MKIGILTFHRAHNYGAVLQAYALVTYLRQSGYDAEIVDYRPLSIEQGHGVMPIKRLKGKSTFRKLTFIIKLLPFLIYRKKRSNVFMKFINNLPTSSVIYTENSKTIENYDYIICGSDQVWNPQITNGLDSFYTANIKTKAKFTSYAASAEINPSFQKIDIYKDVLKRFYKISVRESIFKNQLQPLTNKPVYQVLDPIFLLSKEEWIKFGKNPFKKKDYLLVYQVRRDKNVLKYAKELSKKNKLEIIEITAEAEFLPKKNRYMTLSPQEFVGAFIYAKAVVTTSFHGTAFAALFQKPVKTMLFNTPGDYRALDLMRTIGLIPLEKYTFSKENQSEINIMQTVEPRELSKKILESKDFLSFNEQ